MLLHEIRPTQKNKNKKRVGRGGKRGTYSGKGQKGQKARAGRMPSTATEIIMKIPKKKGSKNIVVGKERALVIKTGDLEKLAEQKILSREVLEKKGLIRGKRKVKIVLGGEVSSAIKIEGISLSETAKSAVEKAGGSVM
ncbi:hypothetical protein A3A21_00945 [Candidatus Jorgensenbacteria bacterium RIFCSPLOWO2_01_FULL_45_25b]|uniref:Large ribosomal subunit protein uL15 n=1 Tax=Candidatus Jorgensenbacteria bacterium RIFCSPLOWO2_01_FULL_45_25b TaxID=1798471 RepID=A0A1F6BVI3_9BACT|nr:MAG: hypothetical protein A3A21_00945 [Candidatus Jorgensenbacteria bacterium RIFCSPLOWO2_01_FULL_45_25b]